MEKEYCPYCMSPVQEGRPCAVCGLTGGNYMSSPHHLPPKTILKERYLIGRVLGEGGFGITYIGCDLQLELKVAIKEYFPIDCANRIAAEKLSVSNYSSAAKSRYESGKLRFLREARMMAKMDKQQVIVGVRDFFELNNTAYIVMEYVEGITFKEMIEQRGRHIPAGELLRIIEPLFFALAAMHELGLIHRDISPENLMLENGEVRLLDFGCARDSENGDVTLTIALKHGYAPVEQYQNKGQGSWSDVYALCATIYFCLTGKKPPQSMDRLVEDELIPPRKLGAELTEQQEKAILHGMGVRPRQRFRSVMELHTALYKDAAGGENSEIMPERLPESLSDKNSKSWFLKHKKAAIIGGGMAVLSTVAVTFSFWQPWRRTSEEPFSLKVSEGILIGSFAKDNVVLAENPKTSGNKEQLFGDAKLLDNGTSEEFLDLISDKNIPAIILANCNFMFNERVEIKKPIYLMTNCNISFERSLTVGEGGYLFIGGSFLENFYSSTLHLGLNFPPESSTLAANFLRTVDGGKIFVDTGGTINVGMLWLSDAEEFQVKEGIQNISEKFVFSEREIFANAIHVTTEREYRAALRSGDSIVIEGDISITDKTIPSQDIPVLIAEGVTVKAAKESWLIDNTVLVNYGEIFGQLEDAGREKSYIVNYGSLDTKVFFENEKVILNYGNIRIPQGNFSNHTNIFNMGEFIAADVGDAMDGRYGSKLEGWLSFSNGAFYNFGTVVVQYTGPHTDSCTAKVSWENTRFTNGGSVQIGAYGEWINNNMLLNLEGSIHCIDASGCLTNGGIIRNEGADCVLDLSCADSLRDSNTGVIVYGEEMELYLPENISDGGGSLICFDWQEGDHRDYSWVKNLREFEEAMADENCRVIAISSQSEFILPAGMEITKGVAVTGEVNFRTEGDLVLRGEDAFFFSDARVDLSGGKLIVEDGTAMFFSEFSGCEEIILQNKGKLYLDVEIK